MEISVREARAGFAPALAAAERGERVTITKNGKPVAELGPLIDAKPKGLFHWGELDRLQEQLGIPTPSPEVADCREKHFDSEEFNKEIWGEYYA